MSEIVVLGLIGYAAAFLITGEWIGWLRRPIRQRFLALEGNAFARAQETDWKPGHIAHLIASTIGGLLAYLIDCRRCIAAEVIIVWSVVNGWPGWGPVLAAIAVAVFAYELWSKPPT